MADKLTAVVDDITTVPEAAQGFYVEADGKHVLQVAGADSLPSVTGLKSAHEKTTAAWKSVKAELKELGVTKDELTELRKQAEGKGANKEFQVRLDEATVRMKSKFDEQVTLKDGRIETLEGQLEKNLVGAQLDASIADAGIMENMRPMVKAFLRERGPQLKEDSGNFRGVFDTHPDTGLPADMDIGDYVKEWVKTDAAQPFLPSIGTGGGGTSPASRAPTQQGGKILFDGSDPRNWSKYAEQGSEG